MNSLFEPAVQEHVSRELPPLRWMQILSHLDPKYGGVSVAVPSLVQALTEQGVASTVEAFCVAGEEHWPVGMRADTVHFWPLSRLSWLGDAALRARFAAELAQQDGVHLHGLWDMTSAVGSRSARDRHKPYVVSCHGMLEPWALKQGKYKKLLYSALVEKGVVRQARCLHALTQAEALQCRTYVGKVPPKVVIPNGVTVPDAISPELFLSKYPELRERRVVLFLARFHLKKGVDLLARAWKQVAARFPEAALVLAGPDANGLGAALQTMVNDEGMGRSVYFPGMLGGDIKWSALAAAECMVLPSHSEGLSMSVLEAMGAGVPVLVTPQCNMPWISEAGGGWLTEPAPEAIADALLHILGRSPDSNAETGRRARQFILRQYSWSSVAERMAEVYRWCLGGAEPVLSEVLQ